MGQNRSLRRRKKAADDELDGLDRCLCRNMLTDGICRGGYL